MKTYCLSMMVIAGAFVCVGAFGIVVNGVEALGGPKWSIQGETYRQYANFEYFRDRLQEQVLQSNGDVADLGDDTELNDRWENFRVSVEMENSESVRRELATAGLLVVVFGAIFAGHLALYQRFGGGRGRTSAAGGHLAQVIPLRSRRRKLAA